MHCILVFDHLNDIIFSKCDKDFVNHINNLERNNGSHDAHLNGDEEVSLNFVIQLFSPIVTSQRIMSSQFGNSYTSIQCQDGINMVFDEYAGYLFVGVATEEVSWLKRILGISVSIVQHLTGPHVSILKADGSRSELVTRLIDEWVSLVSRDQSLLLEAIEQLTVNPDLSAAALSALKDSTDRIKALLDYSKSHALLFVENKFLALYSSKAVKELSTSDLLFLSLFAHSSPGQSDKPEEGVVSEMVLLSGSMPSTCPYVLHVASMAPRVALLLLYQTEWDVVTASLIDAMIAISNITSAMYNEKEGVRRGMEALEPPMKKLIESVKKIKTPDLSPKLDACIKVLHVKWDLLKKQWSDGQERAVTACAGSLGLCLRDLFEATTLDNTPVMRGHPAAQAIARCVHNALALYLDFLQVKAITNFSLGSRGSLSINKYLEEFPGLVHFLYIDRTTHRLTAPSLQPPQPPPFPQLNTDKVWAMVETSRAHLHEGHLTIMWRDHSFNYAYFLWFEDNSGSPLKPKVSPATVVRSLPLPGVFSSDFYKRLMESCFPKMRKLRCYELYCIHIGLVTSALVLEQSRRIAATISELTGVPTNPNDIL